jgi:CRP-like cAMP-binding protein
LPSTAGSGPGLASFSTNISEPTLDRKAKILPALTADQIARIALHGTTRRAESGEVLAEMGDYKTPFLVLLAGSLEVTRATPYGEEILLVGTSGTFFGDVTMLSNRASLVCA